jgi:hypothetical protein
MAIAIAVVVVSATAWASDPAPKLPPIPTPEPEVAKDNVTLDLPNVPSFAVPQAGTPRALRLDRGRYLDTEVEVTGYVTWVYDCLLTAGSPSMSIDVRRRVIADDPSLCLSPHFFVGDTAKTLPANSIWVVDLPRDLRDDERKLLTADEIAALPPVPRVRVGDRVTIAGTWATRSPRGFAREDGLLVFGDLRSTGGM